MIKLICVMGKSCSGKSWVIDRVIEDFSTARQVKSKTDRSIREDDPNDINTHIFTSREDFLSDKKNGNIISLYTNPETETHNWITKECFNDSEEIINVMAIDPTAYKELIDNHSDIFDVMVGFYVLSEDRTRLERSILRGTPYSEDAHLDWSTIGDLEKYRVEFIRN